jgi:acyl homoserine lactone synthase
MIRYILGGALGAHGALAESMFRDRAAQFRDRLKWDVTVDARGWERDEYTTKARLT